MRDMVIVGNGTIGDELAKLVLSNKKLRYKLNGFVCDKETDFVEFDVEGQTRRVPVLGVPSSLSFDVLKSLAYRKPQIVLTIEDGRDDNLIREISKCIKNGIEVHEGGNLYEELTGKIPVKHVREKWLVDGLNKPDTSYRGLKRFLDFVASFLGFILLLPLFVCIALLIKIDSKGHAIYRQTRTGENGEEFEVYKFRTMVEDAENGEAVWAEIDDERVTRVGKWLRKARFDEFPQLLNVLKGEMSLVGPRPERPEFIEILEKEIPFYGYRHIVKPGITGWAQIKYRYANCINSSLEKLQYDLYGIKHSSFLFDLKILFQTVWVMLTARGAH